MSVPCEVPARVVPHAVRTRTGRRREARLAVVPPAVEESVVDEQVVKAPARRARRLRALGDCGPRVRRPGFVPEVQEPGVRLTVRGRRVVASLVVAVALVTVGVATWRFAAMVTGPDSPIPADAPATVVVEPGDSLWSIARSVAPDADARAVVQELLERNRLDSSQVRIGERLVVGG